MEGLIVVGEGFMSKLWIWMVKNWDSVRGLVFWLMGYDDGLLT